MDVEKILTEGLVFKGTKNEPNKKDEPRIKTKAKKSTYAKGLHGSDSSKMKAEMKRKRAARHKNK